MHTDEERRLAGCGRLPCESWESHRDDLGSKSCESAVAVPSTHSGADDDRCRFSRLSKIAHMQKLRLGAYKAAGSPSTRGPIGLERGRPAKHRRPQATGRSATSSLCNLLGTSPKLLNHRIRVRAERFVIPIVQPLHQTDLLAYCAVAQLR
jgi:hypothetical protein